MLFRLKDQLRVKTNLGYRIEVHPHGSLPRYEVKGKRFKDLRKGGDDMPDVNIKDLDQTIQRMRQLAEELKVKAGDIQAIERNLDHILASIKMLELNISDAKEFV
jgi:prefoldin subunit 5